MTAVELRIENDDQKKVVPSSLYNNLATVGGLRLFAFKKEAVVLKPPSSVRLLSLDARANGGKKRGTVTHVSAATVEGKLTAAVTATDGTVELWDLSKELLISTTVVAKPLPTTSEGGAADPTAVPLVPQCTAFGTNNGASYFLTGVSNGSVSFYSVNHELQATPLAKLAGAHQPGAVVTAVGTAPIQASTSSPIMAASGDDNGTVVFYGRTMNILKVVPAPPEAEGGGDCVVSIVASANHFIVAYGGGKIRLFSNVNGALAVEVAAHARWINAMAIEPTQLQHLATCGDDGMIMVWKIPTDGDARMALIGQKFMKNYLWTGVAFAEVGQLYASAYDVDRAYTFSY